MTVLVRDLDRAISAAFMARVRSFKSEHETFKELANRWLAYDEPETEARRIELVTGLTDARSRLEKLDNAYYVEGRFKGSAGEDRYSRMRDAIEQQLHSSEDALSAIQAAVDLTMLKDAERLRSAWLSADLQTARMLLRVVLHSVTVLPPRGQGCKRNWIHLLTDCCFHWVGESQQPLRRDSERIRGLVLFEEDQVSLNLAA